MALDDDTFNLLRASVQRFVIERLIPAQDYVEENDSIPDDIVSDIKEMGLYGLSIPEEYGGIGLSMAPIGVLLVTLPSGEVGEYWPFVSP